MYNITDFLRHTVSEAGITDKDLQDQAIEELELVLIDRLVTGLVSKLSHSGQDKAIDLMNKNFQQGLEYIKKELPNFDIEYEKLLVQFAGEYLQKMKEPVKMQFG